MSEFGQLIDPYRVAPPKGDVLGEYYRVFQQQENINKMREDAQLGQMTRSFLTQQLGLPEGVDPFAIQQHQIARNADQRAQAAEGRNAQEWQQMQQFGQNFPQQVQQQYQGQKMSPLVRALINSGGGAFGAKTMAGALAPMQQNADEIALKRQLGEMQLKGQKDINAANNQSEIARQRILNQGALGRVQEELNAKKRSSTEATAQTRAAMNKFYTTGDPTDLLALNPDLLGNDTFNATVSDVQKRVKAESDKGTQDKRTDEVKKRAAEQAARQGLTPEQQLEVQREMVDNLLKTGFGSRESKLDYASRKGSPELVAAVKAILGPEYDAVYNARMARENQQRFDEAKYKAGNPILSKLAAFANLLTD